MSFWSAIQRHLDSKGISPGSLESFREFIDAPDIPIELPSILENFLLLLPHLNSIIPCYHEFFAKPLDSNWKAICQEIIAHPDWDSLAAPLRKTGKKPLTGHYEKNKVYVSLWTRPADRTVWGKYYSLFAHVCLAVSVLRSWMKKQLHNDKLTPEEKDNFNHRIYVALLTIRNLAEIENRDTLEELPNLTVNPHDLLRIVQSDNATLQPLTPLFKYLLKLRKSVHRHPGESRQHGPRKIPPHLKAPAILVDMGTNLDPEQEGIVPGIEILQLPTLNDSESDNVESVGCSSGEAISGTEIAIITSAVQRKVLPQQQKANHARQIKHQLAMRNQLLPSRWETLSLYEISSFLAAVVDLIHNRERSRYFSSDVDPGELTALLTTMFWFGQRLESAVRLKCYQGRVQSNETEPGFVTVNEHSGYWWTVPALRPRKIFPDSHQITKTRAVVNAFPIVSGINIEWIVIRYVSENHRQISGQLFPKTVEHYQTTVTAFLSLVNRHHGTRLTANRIADYLFDTVSRRDGSDLTTAMYLTGRHHFLGTNLSSYTAIPVSKLQSTYRDVCMDIRNRHFHERPRDHVNTDPHPVKLPQSYAFVGSPFVPKRETIKELNAHLKEKLKDCSLSKPSLLKLMRLHNNMTRYTAFLVGFCTGFRAVRDPFLSAAEIDWQTGFAILSDKDNDDCYNSRLIWMPPVCLEQLTLFREHLHNALFRFSTLIHNFYAQLAAPRRQGPGRHMFFSWENSNNHSYEPLNLGPARIGWQLKQVYGLPFNTSRHYLRSSLLEAGCPVEIINAYMGHWERGEEPWGPYSGLSPLAYREALQTYLLPILMEDGWEPLPGLGSEL